MSEQYNMGKLGVVAPFKAKEGTITISEGASAHGTIKVPVLSAALKKGQFVELDGDLTVKALTTSGTAIGIVYNEPKWNVEPTTDRTQAQAVSAGELREVGIETIYKKILTVPVKSSESIAAGKYLVADDTTAGEFKLSASSGATASDVVALTAKSSDNTVVAGFL